MILILLFYEDKRYNPIVQIHVGDAEYFIVLFCFVCFTF